MGGCAPEASGLPTPKGTGPCSGHESRGPFPGSLLGSWQRGHGPQQPIPQCPALAGALEASSCMFTGLRPTPRAHGPLANVPHLMGTVALGENKAEAHGAQSETHQGALPHGGGRRGTEYGHKRPCCAHAPLLTPSPCTPFWPSSAQPRVPEGPGPGTVEGQGGAVVAQRGRASGRSRVGRRPLHWAFGRPLGSPLTEVVLWSGGKVTRCRGLTGR